MLDLTSMYQTSQTKSYFMAAVYYESRHKSSRLYTYGLDFLLLEPYERGFVELKKDMKVK